MEELGIRQILARSPQAKGRVERAAGTFQDRLVTELRLHGAASITEANEVLNRFISRFNEKFGVKAEQDCPAYRCLEESVSLDGILCFKHRRKVSRDNTVKYNRRTLQLLPDGTRPTFAGMQAAASKALEANATPASRHCKLARWTGSMLTPTTRQIQVSHGARYCFVTTMDTDAPRTVTP